MPQPHRHRLLLRAARVAIWLENALLFGLLGGLICLAAAQILLRNLFSVSFSWADGLIRLAVLWLAVIGAVAASRDGKHISIKLAERLLPAVWWRPVAAVIDLFAACVCGALAWYAWTFVSLSREFGDLLLGSWPAWMLQAILPVGFALLAYRYLINALSGSRGGG